MIIVSVTSKEHKTKAQKVLDTAKFAHAKHNKGKKPKLEKIGRGLYKEVWV